MWLKATLTEGWWKVEILSSYTHRSVEGVSRLLAHRMRGVEAWQVQVQFPAEPQAWAVGQNCSCFLFCFGFSI